MAEKVRWLNKNCYYCGSRMNSWDNRLTKTFKTHDCCEECFCKIYGMKKDAFRKTMEEFWGIRPCQGI